MLDARAAENDRHRQHLRKQDRQHPARFSAACNRASAQKHRAVKAQRIELERKRERQRDLTQTAFHLLQSGQRPASVNIQRFFLLRGKPGSRENRQIVGAHVEQQRILDDRRRQIAAGVPDHLARPRLSIRQPVARRRRLPIHRLHRVGKLRLIAFCQLVVNQHPVDRRALLVGDFRGVFRNKPRRLLKRQGQRLAQARRLRMKARVKRRVKPRAEQKRKRRNRGNRRPSFSAARSQKQRRANRNPDHRAVRAHPKHQKRGQGHAEHKPRAKPVTLLFQKTLSNHLAEHQQHRVAVRNILEDHRDVVAVHRRESAQRKRKRPQPDRRAKPAHDPLAVPDHRRRKDCLHQHIGKQARVSAAQRMPQPGCPQQEERQKRRMMLAPRQKPQNLVKLRLRIRIHGSRIADRQMRQPAEQHGGHTKQQGMRPIRPAQRAVSLYPQIQPSVQPGLQQAEKQLEQARHAQRQHRRLELLAAGKEGLIQVVRVDHADRDHLPNAEKQRRQPNPKPRFGQALVRPAQRQKTHQRRQRYRAARPHERLADVDVIVAAAHVQIHKHRPRHQPGAQHISDFQNAHLFFVTYTAVATGTSCSVPERVYAPSAGRVMASPIR